MKNYLLLLFLALTSIASGNERLYFSNLSLGDGLSQITVSCIHQDNRGFMWFGTRNGLNRYDGYSFDIYVTNPEDNSSISDNHILCISEDESGNLWVGTNNGLNYLDRTTNKFKRYYSEPDNEGSLSHNTIYGISYDDQNNLWVGTGSGLDLFDKETGIFHHIIIEDLLEKKRINKIVRRGDELYLGSLRYGLIIYNLESKQYTMYNDILPDPYNIGSSQVKSILFDRDDNLWIGTQEVGVGVLKKGEDKFIRYTQKNGLTNNNVRSIAQAPDGNLIIGTFNGLNILDPKTEEITQYIDYGVGQGMLSHYSIIDVYFDRSQTLWIGTYGGGICYYNRYGQKFRFIDPNIGGKNLLGILGPIVELNNSLYIATEGGGLLEMNKNTKTIKNYEIFEGVDRTYGKNIIKSLYLDGTRILCGTNIGTIYNFDIHTKKFSLFCDLGEARSVYYIGKSLAGDIVIGGVNEQGFMILHKSGNLQKTFPVKGKENIYFSDVRCVLEVEKNVFLIGTRNDGLYCYDYNQQTSKNYKNDITEKSENEIPENFVTSIMKDTKGRVWVGTYGGGIAFFDMKAETFTTYNAKNNLQNNNICEIVEGDNNHLWISTISGISDFNIESGTFENYTHANGIKVDEFSLHAGTRLSNNDIMFSGNNGLTSFNPQRMSVNPYIPPIILKNLFINNDKIIPGGDDNILSEDLDTQKEIVLKYDQSNITIEYSALSYIYSDRNQYTYKLEGFDEEWNNVGSRRMAYYTNIPAGEYRFVVRGSNNDGVWNDEGTSIRIIVKPPFWKTWWAYSIYVLFIAAIIWFIIRYFSEKKRLQDDIKMKQVEAKASEEFHQARNKLFTNFSHELRTPLTLIISPLDDMAGKADLPPKIMDNVYLMQNNARRLLRIVNNLMDFQKKESGTMKLQVSEGDFVSFTNEMILHFKELAASRKIHFEFNHTVGTLQYCFDKELMEKVYFNFLSNAFKNVPNQGTVEVNMDKKSLEELKLSYPEKIKEFNNLQILYITLEIKNSGEGIAQDELEKIFIPFYQVAQNEHSASGTGLGLSLSKSIIEVHHGVIWAESPGGKGAIFRCILPIDKELFRDEDFANEIGSTSDFPYSVDVSKENGEEGDIKKKVYTILVVEDNIDVRRYIVSHLKDSYNVMEASNGIEALEKAINHLPDLIISDLMMPKMDGMEFCEKIKHDIRTSHIPVIMLTARTMTEDMKQGYEAGADDYITKPFSSLVLVSRVNNIIQSREKLKELYGKRFSLETLGVEATSVDERFMQKLYDILEKNVSNPELNLDEFSRDVGMSRANLYRKIKSITNLSPNEFIRNFRLNMGAKMLKEAQMPVSEVYVAVGFNSHAYFSNCFKAYYGVSPSEYANQQ